MNQPQDQNKTADGQYRAGEAGANLTDVLERVSNGQRVIDRNKTIGTVQDGSDLHNILVIYEDNGGQGLYCLDTDCAEYEPLYAL